MNLSRIIVLTSLSFLGFSQNVFSTERFVSLVGNHQPPFTNWADAATNIQDAIDSSVAGDTVWVTNGVYSTGGKVMSGGLTNRVALDKALTLRSVNGYSETTINGTGGAVGTTAVRCAWLTNDATLIGFTLQNGATRSGASSSPTTSGGAVWCASTAATVANCLIRSNAAIFGGGVFQGTINNSVLLGNKVNVGSGSASYQSFLKSCTVVTNSGTAVSSGQR